ncbi:MAG: hypothetical protein IT581_13115 [Verrucomicrobiales bacterium]|nr:hypothetical protein [Verrucomicrobiales bacterium]
MLALRFNPRPTAASPGQPPPEATAAVPPKVEAEPSRGAAITDRYPRSLNVLSLSWLHGKLEAVAIQKGQVTQAWERPEACDEPGRFGELVKEAATRTKFHGTTVSLVLAHPRLTHQLVETPPAKGAALEALVQRQIERLKVFEGEPVWSFQRALPTKNAQSVLVHLFPRQLLDMLVNGCERAGFHLISVTPPTGVLQSQLRSLPLAGEDVALIAADTGATTTVLVGRRDGQLMLGRSLDAAHGTGQSNLAVDISRTALFTAQQFGSNVGSVWLFGPALEPRLAELEAQSQVPVRVSPEPHRPFYWALKGPLQEAGKSPNLVSTEQRKAPQRRVLFIAAAALAAALAVTAGATAALCHALVRQEQNAKLGFERRVVELTARHQELQRVHADLNQRAALATAVLDDRLPPVPSWFLAYLSDAVPSSLVLTKASVRWQGSNWVCRLAGVADVPTNAPAAPALAEGVAQLMESLRTGPFQMAIGAPTDESGPPAAAAAAPAPAFSAIAEWATRLSGSTPSPSANPVTHSANTFDLEGTFR